ncbi:hypothetical protein B0H14DRAFT_1314786 [Mycena olivaceomarginata]|nr:hypothetical protein B0H14DRAFT_1314786 [Mycena olivaceomarginata]
MVVDDVLPKTKSGGRSRKPRNSNSSAGSSKSSKAVLADLSPQSLRLANKGRVAVRLAIATQSAFPDEPAEWTLRTIKKAVAPLNDQQLSERLDMADNDTDRGSKIVSYAWGGASQLRGEVKTLCKAAVCLFGIPGKHSNQEIVDIIKWLTSKKGIFKFGDLDIAARTHNAQKPYGHPFYQDVITKQFFSSAVAEGVRAISYEQFIDPNIPVVALVTDGMENALKEFASGVRVNIKFTTEEYGPRYGHHRQALESLKQKSPGWFAAFLHDLYSQIVQHTNFQHLKTMLAEQEGDELADVDFAALEASVSATAPA